MAGMKKVFFDATLICGTLSSTFVTTGAVVLDINPFGVLLLTLGAWMAVLFAVHTLRQPIVTLEPSSKSPHYGSVLAYSMDGTTSFECSCGAEWVCSSEADCRQLYHWHLEEMRIRGELSPRQERA